MSDDRILLAHGSGGKLSHDLVEQVFVRHFDNPTLLQLDWRDAVETTLYS